MQDDVHICKRGIMFDPFTTNYPTSNAITAERFQRLMQTIADGWNTGDASKAAACYTENACYCEPPDKQVYVGRSALYAFFGGDKKPEPPMFMIWHHLAFNETEQIGFGEYTYKGRHQYHGIVIVKVTHGLISHWREYQYQSALPWQEFTARSPF